jgi:hypothetical protein
MCKYVQGHFQKSFKVFTITPRSHSIHEGLIHIKKKYSLQVVMALNDMHDLSQAMPFFRNAPTNHVLG